MRSPKSFLSAIYSILSDSQKIRLISLFLPLLILAGCQKPVDQKNPPTDLSRENVNGKLLVWYAINNEDQAVLDRFIKSYQDIYPNIKIIKEYIPQEKIVDRLVNRVNAGLGPDLVFLWQPMLPSLINEKVIQVVPKKEVDTSIYAPATLARVTDQKHLYGLPISLHTSVLCYNQAQVATAPTTINELLTLANTGKSVGLYADLYSLFWLLGLFGGNLQYLPNHQIRLNNPAAWVQWLEIIRELQINQNIVLNHRPETLNQAFVQGKLAFLVCPTTEIPFLQQKLGDRLQIALLPNREEKTATPLLFMRVAVFNRESTPAQTELALKFVRFMTNKDQQLLISSNLQSFIATNQKVTIDPRLSPRSSILLQQAKESVAIPLTYQKKVNEFFEKSEPFYQQMKGGEISPQQLVERMQQVLEEINKSTK
jgi:ABC-type glycerol-3-phosphate transport system substrate-binding protein